MSGRGSTGQVVASSVRESAEPACERILRAPRASFGTRPVWSNSITERSCASAITTARRPDASAPGSPARRATTGTSAPSPQRHRWSRVCRITGQRAQCVHALGDGLIAHDRLDPLRKPLRRLDADGQQPEDQLRQHQQRRGGLRALRDLVPIKSASKDNSHADQQHQQTEADDVRPDPDGTGSR